MIASEGKNSFPTPKASLIAALLATGFLCLINAPAQADDSPLAIHAKVLTAQELDQVRGHGGSLLAPLQILSKIILWDEGGGKNKLYFQAQQLHAKGTQFSMIATSNGQKNQTSTTSNH